ncbi:hypothetical protein ACHQM5_016461 [Ranunculus cassubicifolius]
MAEEKKEAAAVGGGDLNSSARVSPLFPAVSVSATPPPPSSSSSQIRQRFSIELKPEETTIVSWKKLVKESNKKTPTPISVEQQPPSGAHPGLESRLALPAPPSQAAEGEGNDASATNRFSAVIEKIERLYVGNESSEEEELANVPDDDQYDTEDSFIDDADLDEYFQVDKSTTKHKGFFVNRGTLERSNEQCSSPTHQPKKRSRKDSTTQIEKDEDNLPNKQAKTGNVKVKAAAKTATSIGGKSSLSQSMPGKTDNCHDEKSVNKSNAQVMPPKKKSSDLNIKLDQHVSSETHIDHLATKEGEKHKSGVALSGSKSKIASESSEATHQIYHDKPISQIDPQSRRTLNDSKDLEQSAKIRQREKNIGYESPNHNSRTKSNMQTTKSPLMHSKDGSTVRPKGTVLERAIRDLEDLVNESRPPSAEIPDPDSSSQGIKRRLPRDVKQKLAKVARLAQSTQGKISDELLNRLMSIVGHIMQKKSLKRNLREMVVRGISAKREKDVKFQQIKSEMVDMIRVRPPYIKSKGSGQQDGSCDDFQDEKGIKPKVCMDNAMEDKICDLYDLYVEGMDEDKSSQVRKLYVELADLWPNGAMDNHGIKNAVCRSKARKRAIHSRVKSQEKVKQQKVTSSSSTLRVEDTPVAQLQQQQNSNNNSNQGLTVPNRTTQIVAPVNQLPGVASGKMSGNGLGITRNKEEKVKGVFIPDEVVKKKVKRKPAESDGHFRPVKLPSSQEGEKKQKVQRQDLNLPTSDVQMDSDNFS